MRRSTYLPQEKKWRNTICQFYQTSLSLYPKRFRYQFGFEMSEVFEEALDEQVKQGWASFLLFLGREFIETPISALHQHFLIKASWFMTYLNIIFAYTLGFFLLGLMEILNTTSFQNDIQGYMANLLNHLIVGGLGGLTVGIIIAPHKKTLFALGGIFCLLVPIIFPGRANLIFYFLIYFVLFLAIRNWIGLLRLAGYGLLALLVGFFVNRFIAALVQSYLYHSPTQILSQTGAAMVLIPFLITGLSLGILLGGIKPKSSMVKA